LKPTENPAQSGTFFSGNRLKRKWPKRGAAHALSPSSDSGVKAEIPTVREGIGRDFAAEDDITPLNTEASCRSGAAGLSFEPDTTVTLSVIDPLSLTKPKPPCCA
jgi:hypothetical protein